MNRKLTIFTVLTLAVVLMGALTSQVNTYVNGNTLTADQLNSEFGNIYSTINNLDDANFSASPALDPVKISSTVAGDGLDRNVTTGILSVGVDDSTIEIDSDILRVKDLGITSAKLAATAVTAGKIAASAVTTTEILDATIAQADLSSNSVTSAKIVNGTIVGADFADDSITSAKIQDGTLTRADHADRSSSATATLGNVAISSGSGDVIYNSSDPDDDIPNNSVSLTTGGSPVIVQLVPIASTSTQGVLIATSGTCEYTFSRGATVIGRTTIVNRSPPAAFTVMDHPAAGTYTYKASYVTSCDGRIFNVRLLAYEL